MDKQTGIIAIVVTFNPDLNILERLVDQCRSQVDALVLVDNGDGVSLANWLLTHKHAHVELLALGENKGIAAAQNAGIHWAREKGANYVLIFDHDSVPPSGLVDRLRAALFELETAGKKVAAVGPRYIDTRWQEAHAPSPFVRFKGPSLIRYRPEKGSAYVPVDFLISSGSLMPMKALDTVGNMKDELFIDYVDVEWGLRARQAGWSLYGVWDALMDHSLGDAQVAVLGREFVVHSPLRHYYTIRNALWLCLNPGLLWKWKFVIGYNALKKFVAYSVFMPEPLKHFRFMCKGIRHALTGRMGRYE